MGSPSELSLDYKPTTYPMIPKAAGDQPEQTQKLQEFLTCLEEERLKIEAFKRELPLCMQLLNSAMETYRQQLETYQTSHGPRPVLEEFIPLSNVSVNGSEKSSSAPSEKASWMVSAQLWSPSADSAKQQQQTLIAPLKETNNPSFDVSPKLALDSKQRNGGAFLPFSKERNKVPGSASRVVAELALASPEKEVEEKKCSEAVENGGMGVRRENGCKGGGPEHGKGGGNSSEGAQTHRKARRCWSPDLHRRFVNALQMLGGSHVATPKQIRELMKVDGLTNDEVKSHLQKYRLHTRRPIPAPQPAAATAPQLVVLGGIWVPPEYATSAAGPALYGSHPAAAAAAHYCTPAPLPPQDFYSPPPAALHRHQHQLQFHRSSGGSSAFKGRLGSPEIRERSESIEDEDGEEREEEEEEMEGEEEEEEERDEEEEETTEEEKGDEKTKAASVVAGGKSPAKGDSNGGEVPLLKF